MTSPPVANSTVRVRVLPSEPHTIGQAAKSGASQPSHGRCCHEVPTSIGTCSKIYAVIAMIDVLC